MPEKKIKISVLLPVYNGEEFLEETLRNIANQTYDNFEVIILDNLSSDSTSEICKKFCNIDQRFIYILDNKKRNGNDCIYELIKFATGEYCIVANDDNLFDKKAFEILIGQISYDKKVEWLILNGYYVNSQKTKIKKLRKSVDYLSGYPTFFKVIKSFLYNDYIATLLCSIYKLETFKKLLPYINLSKFENEADILMCLKIFSNLNIKFLDIDILFFRVYDYHERYHDHKIPNKFFDYYIEKFYHSYNFIKSSTNIFIKSKLNFFEKIILILSFSFIYLLKKFYTIAKSFIFKLRKFFKK